MKQVITLKRIGAFPEDVQLIPDDDAQKSILVFNHKEYKYDPDTHLPVRTGWVMCFQPASDSKREDKLVVKIAPSNRSQWAETSVLRFVQLYPQQGGVYGTFTIKHSIKRLNAPLWSEEGMMWQEKITNMDISVLPYLGNDLGFLLEESRHLDFLLDSQQLSRKDIVAKINVEYARAAQIRSEFSNFQLGNFNASNIIVSWNMQNIYIINQYVKDTDSKYERARLNTIRKKLLEEKLPSPIHESTPLAIEHIHKTLAKDQYLLIEQEKYQHLSQTCFNEVIIEIDSRLCKIIKSMPARFDGQCLELNTLREFRNYLEGLSERRVYSIRHAELLMEKKLADRNIIDNYISVYALKVVQKLMDKANYTVTSTIFLDNIISYLKQIISSPFMQSTHTLASNALACAQDRKNHMAELAKQKKSQIQPMNFFTQIVTALSLVTNSNNKHTQINELKNNSTDKQKISNQRIYVFDRLPETLYQPIFCFLSIYSTLTFRISCKAIYNISVRTPLAPIATYMSRYNLFIDLTKASTHERNINVIKKDVLDVLMFVLYIINLFIFFDNTVGL